MHTCDLQHFQVSVILHAIDALYATMFQLLCEHINVCSSKPWLEFVLFSMHDSFQVICHVKEEDLPHLILTLEGTGFLSLAHCSKQVSLSS